jgi:hypothetical protein
MQHYEQAPYPFSLQHAKCPKGCALQASRQRRRVICRTPVNPHSDALNVAFVTSVRLSMQSFNAGNKWLVGWLVAVFDRSGTAVAELALHRP